MWLMLATTLWASADTVELMLPESMPEDHSSEVFVGQTSRVRTTLEDQDITGEDARVNCSVRDGEVMVGFVGSSADWPSEFPIKSHCTVGKRKIRVVVKSYPGNSLEDNPMVSNNENR